MCENCNENCLPVELCIDPADLPGGGQSGGPFNLVIGGPEVPVSGEYWEGKQVYAKRIDFGALPNNKSKYIAHGLTNMQQYTLDTARSWTVAADGVTHGLFNYSSSDNSSIWFDISLENIRGTTKSNRTNMSAIVTVLFTKTTD